MHVCYLDEVTAWKCPAPMKWAVVVKVAHGLERPNQLAILAENQRIFTVRGSCAKYHHDGPFRGLGVFPGCHPI